MPLETPRSRENHSAPMGLDVMQTGKACGSQPGGDHVLRRRACTAARSGGPKSQRANPAEAQDAGLVRQAPTSGRVLGIKATSEGKTLNIRAQKAVILATGGSSNNVNFRRMFDVRLTEEYNGVAGEPYSFQDGSGELAGIAIGASSWGAYNQVGEFGDRLTKAGRIGTPIRLQKSRVAAGKPALPSRACSRP